MAQLLVRNLDEDVKTRLQQRAKRHGRSMEAEVRDILRNAIAQETSVRAHLGTNISKRFRSVGLDTPVEELRNWEIRTPDFAE